jgi:hypothetical protein
MRETDSILSEEKDEASYISTSNSPDGRVSKERGNAIMRSKRDESPFLALSDLGNNSVGVSHQTLS